MRISFLGPLALGLLAASCGDGLPDVLVGPTPRGPYAVSDSLTYQTLALPQGIGETVRITYTNLWESPVYFARCAKGDTIPTYGVVRAGPDSLTPLTLDRMWGCIGGVSTGTIDPGEGFTVTVDLSGYDDPAHPVPVEQRTGSMRVVFDLCWRYRSESGDCELLDTESRGTNIFTLLPPVSDSPAP